VPHVTDFGLARRAEGAAGQTQSGAIVGTPAYMPPEQARGQKVLTTAVDVYSLGAVLYELLTGRPPFQAATAIDTALQVLEREPERPRAVNPAAEPDLETICLKCLEKEPAKRYGSAEAVAEDLERWLRGEPIQARPARRGERVVKWVKRRPAVAALLGALAVSLAALLAGGVLFTAGLDRARRAAADRAAEATAAQHEASAAQKTAEQERERAEANLYASRMPLAYGEWRNGFVDRAENILDGYLFSGRRGWEWHYLKGLCHRDLRTFPGEGWVAYSPDGKWLATVARADKRSGLTGEVTVIRDAAGGAIRFQLDQGKGRRPHRFAFTADGKTLVTTDDEGGFKTWDMANGKLLLDVPGEKDTDSFGYVAVSPKGLVALLRPGQLALREVATGKEAHAISLRTLTGAGMLPGLDPRSVTAVAFSPDGARVAAGVDRAVLIFDATTGKYLRGERGHTGWVSALAFSPDGKRLLSASSDGTLRLWDQSGVLAEPRVLHGHGGHVYGAAFSRDGQWCASTGSDSTVRIWDSETGAELAVLRGHDAASGWLAAVSFHPGGKQLASVGGDAKVKVWDLQAALSPAWPGTIDTKGLCDLAFSPDGRFLALGRVLIRVGLGEEETAGRVELWEGGRRAAVLDPVTLKKSDQFLHLKRVAFSPDGTQLATVDARVSWSGWCREGIPPPADVKIWDVATGKLLRALDKAGDQVVFSPDGRWVAVTRTPHPVEKGGGRREAEGGQVRSEGLYKLSEQTDDEKRRKTEGGQVRFWDARTGRPAFALDESTDPVSRLAFTPDGRFLVTTHDNKPKMPITVWEMTATGPVARHRFGKGRTPTSLAVSPDGRFLATATTPGEVDVWELPAGRPAGTIRESRGKAYRSWSSGDYPLVFSENHLAFSPDGKRLAYPAWDSLRLWDPRSGQEVLVLEKDPEWIHRLHFSPDGRRLLLLGEKERWRAFDAAPLSPERLYSRAVPAYVNRLSESVRLKSLVVERIRADATTDEAFRALALREAAELPEDAEVLNAAAWEVAVQPGLSAAAYARALKDAEASRDLAPDNPDVLNTLGAAQYRAGRHAEALRTLLRADALRRKKEGQAAVADLLFLAMTSHRLGKAREAGDYLEKARVAMKDPGRADDEESRGLLRELEALLNGRDGAPR
jgi:WD40 repeat protein